MFDFPSIRFQGSLRSTHSRVASGTRRRLGKQPGGILLHLSPLTPVRSLAIGASVNSHLTFVMKKSNYLFSVSILHSSPFSYEQFLCLPKHVFS